MDLGPDVPRYLCYRPSHPPPGPARTVHFIRHGESAHQVVNAAAALRGEACRCPDLAPDDPARLRCPYRDPALTDSPLTAKGRLEGRGVAAASGAELVLAATLTRCLETAELAFVGTRAPPIVALDELRPRISHHRHSRRAPIASLRPRFPAVDFSEVADDEDRLWCEADERRASIDARTARFLARLAAHPARNLAVVCHFTTLFALFAPAADTRMLGRSEVRPVADPAWLRCADPDDPDHPLRRYLAPGEVRSFLLVPG